MTTKKVEAILSNDKTQSKDESQPKQTRKKKEFRERLLEYLDSLKKLPYREAITKRKEIEHIFRTHQ